MKNILVVSYYFPPSGGPGVQRVLKHVRYLRDFGYNPIILTVSNGTFPARDESLFKEIPDGTHVERTHIYEPYDIYRLLTGKKKGEAIDVNVIKKEDQKRSFKEKAAEFVRATFFIPDARAMWRITARKAVDKLIEQYNIATIYSSSPPYTCSLIARDAKRRHGLKWVAGFRDPWTEFLTTPKRWSLPASIDRVMEYSVFREADAVECAWEGIIKDALNKYPDLDKGKFFHVPNGFDSNDFPTVGNNKTDKFTITYTGSMYGRRNPKSFLQAVTELIDSGEVSADKIHLRFVGRFGAEVHDMFDSFKYKSTLEIIGYVAHEKSIEMLLESDSLLLVVDEAKESEEIVPGKVYEYVGVKKPIIAIAPKDSAIASLLEETGTGLVSHQSDNTYTKSIFLQYYNAWLNNTQALDFNHKAIQKYERRESAKMLAELFNRI